MKRSHVNTVEHKRIHTATLRGVCKVLHRCDCEFIKLNIFKCREDNFFFFLNYVRFFLSNVRNIIENFSFWKFLLYVRHIFGIFSKFASVRFVLFIAFFEQQQQ